MSSAATHVTAIADARDFSLIRCWRSGCLTMRRSSAHVIIFAIIAALLGGWQRIAAQPSIDSLTCIDGVTNWDTLQES